MQIAIREVSRDEIRDRAEVVRWVLRTWIRTFTAAARAIGVMRGSNDPVYYRRQHETILTLLRRPRCRLLYAHLPGEPDLFVGWICAEPGTLHYVAVKPLYQGLGVARRLVSAAVEGGPTQYTHAGPRTVMDAAQAKGWAYSPHLLARKAS